LIFSRSVGASGKVISIEAHPRTFSSLKKFCELNRLSNTTCLQLAVVDNQCEVYMDDLPDNLVNSAALVASEESVFKVPGMSLDQICKMEQVGRIDFLKINIEGAESLAIGGMAETITKTKYACIACHDFRAAESQKFSTREIVLDFLRRNNFQVVMRPDDRRRYVRDHLHAINKALVPDWGTIAELAGSR
jgi:FkbM family methyltransferase